MSVRKGVRPIPAVALTMVAEEQAKDVVKKIEGRQRLMN